MKMRLLCVVFLVVCFCDLSFSQSDIRLPPSITVGPPKDTVIYRSDDNVTLDCIGKGVPGVTYEWKKNGVELNQTFNIIRRDSDGTITIENATSVDEGFYQCFAKNSYGTAVSLATRIRRAVTDATSGSPKTLHETVQEGQPFLIQADPSKSFPKPTYGWVMATDTVDKNPVSIQASSRIQMAENGDLHFAYALPEDDLGGKLYRFTTHNPFLDIVVGGNYTKLNVTRVTDAGVINRFPPTLGFASETQTVAVIGDSVTLRCFFYGNPEPTISWYRTRYTLPKRRYEVNSFNTAITLFNITTTDEGGYNCAASNIEGRNTHILQILVDAVPRFLSIHDGPRDVNVTEGDSVTFHCRADAKPEATIVWMENGNRIDPDNLPKRFEFSKDKKSLTISNVCRDCDDRERKTDLTVIQCNASNVHGYAFAQGYLNVLLKTVVTIHNRRNVFVDEQKEGRVSFNCRATSDPSTPPIIRWYRVTRGYDQLLYNDPPFLTVSGGLLSIHVATKAAENWPKYLGQYRCVVETGYTRVDETADIIPTGAPPTPTSWDSVFNLTWLWIIIGVVIFLVALIGILCEIYRLRRKNRAELHRIEREAWRTTGPDGTDPSNPVRDTTATDVHVRATWNNVQGVRCEYRPSNNSETRANENGHSTTEDDFVVRTGSPAMESHRGQSGNSPADQQSRSDCIASEDRDLTALHTYAELEMT